MKSEWTKKKISDIAEINPREFISKGARAKKIPMDILRPFTRDVPSYQIEEFNGGTKFRNMDTIMARITPCLENGKTAQVRCLDNGEVGFGSTEYIVFRAKEGTDPDYLYYLICSPLVRDPAIKSMVGSSGRQRVQTDVVSNLQIAVPDYVEQIQIGGILGALDDKIKLNTEINKNLFQQALMLFEHEYVEENASEHQIPLYDFAEYINGSAFRPDELGDTGLPVIKIAELKSGITDSTRFFDGDKGNRYLVANGDILFSWSGNPETSIDIFSWADGNGILNQHTFNVKSKYNCPWFTYLLLKYHKPLFTKVASNKQTTGLGHVTAGDLKRLTFPFNLEQMRKFEDEISPSMSLYYNNLLENRRLESLRDILLPKLMSGEINVSAIDI